MRTRGRATRLTFAARLPRSAAICRDLATGHTHSRSRWSKCNLCTMKWNLEIINKVACHYVTHVRVFLRVCVPAKASLAASHLALVAARAVSPGRELQSL